MSASGSRVGYSFILGTWTLLDLKIDIHKFLTHFDKNFKLFRRSFNLKIPRNICSLYLIIILPTLIIT